MKSSESLVRWGRWYLEDRARVSLFIKGLLAFSHPCAALNLEDDALHLELPCDALPELGALLCQVRYLCMSAGFQRHASTLIRSMGTFHDVAPSVRRVLVRLVV